MHVWELTATEYENRGYGSRLGVVVIAETEKEARKIAKAHSSMLYACVKVDMEKPGVVMEAYISEEEYEP